MKVCDEWVPWAQGAPGYVVRPRYGRPCSYNLQDPTCLGGGLYMSRD